MGFCWDFIVFFMGCLLGFASSCSLDVRNGIFMGTQGIFCQPFTVLVSFQILSASTGPSSLFPEPVSLSNSVAFFCSTLRKAQVGWIYCELPFEVPQSTSGWNSSLWGITVTGPAKHPPQIGFRTKHGQTYIQKCRVPRGPLPGSIYTEGGASQSARSTGRNPAEATPGD